MPLHFYATHTPQGNTSITTTLFRSYPDITGTETADYSISKHLREKQTLTSFEADEFAAVIMMVR